MDSQGEMVFQVLLVSKENQPKRGSRETEEHMVTLVLLVLLEKGALQANQVLVDQASLERRAVKVDQEFLEVLGFLVQKESQAKV